MAEPATVATSDISELIDSFGTKTHTSELAKHLTGHTPTFLDSWEDDVVEVGVVGRSGRWTIEAAHQIKIAFPMTVSYAVQTLIPLITFLFLGHLGSDELAASGLATMSANVFGWSVIVGLTSALRTFCSQCYGAKAYLRVGVYIQRAIVVTFAFSLPLATLFWFSGDILHGLGTVPHVATLTGKYLRVLLLNLWPYALFQCTQKWLQTLQIIWPIAIVALIVVVISIPVNWFFIHYMEYGLQAGPYMTIFSFTALDIGLYIYIFWSGIHKQTWGGFTWEAFRELPAYLALAIPGVFMTCLEWWAFEVVTLLASRISKTAVGTQSVLFQSNNFLFTLPLGLSVATAVRVGQFLGQGYPIRARRTVWIAFAVVFVCMTTLAAVQIAARHYWARMFTQDTKVIEEVQKIIIVSCLFEVLDGIVSVGSAVLRGAGKQKFGAKLNALAYWGVGLPLGYSLAFPAGQGLFGLWYGMAAALFLQAVVLFWRLHGVNWKRECDRAAHRAQAQGSPGVQVSLPSSKLSNKTGNVDLSGDTVYVRMSDGPAESASTREKSWEITGEPLVLRQSVDMTP